MIVQRGIAMRTELQRVIGLDVEEGKDLLFCYDFKRISILY